MDEAHGGTNGLAKNSNTQAQIVPDVDPVLLNHYQEQWISFLASGRLVEDEDGGGFKLMSISEFSNKMGIPRRTLYNWKRDIPNFNERVAQRTRELFGPARIGQVWAGVFLKARKGEAQQATMVLSHFSDYVPPAQRVEVDHEFGLADLVQAMRRKKQQQPQEAQVINATVSESTSTATTPDHA